ncbi:MAG: MAPEG family protein [Pseudomonadota bacterium]
MHSTIIICAAIIAGLLIGLGLWMFLQTRRAKQLGQEQASTSDPTHPRTKAKRAHGNSAEYAGALIGLFVLTSFAYEGRDLRLTATALVIAVTVGRALHAAGCPVSKNVDDPHSFKPIGSLLTYGGGGALVVQTIAKVL